MKTIYLAGPMGSGKTTCGKLLADRLGLIFEDTDQCVERDYGCSVSDIFLLEGEDHFRALESQILKRLSTQPPRVVALGGGALIKAENRKIILEKGFLVGLECSVKILCKRLANEISVRPLLKGSVEKRIFQPFGSNWFNENSEESLQLRLHKIIESRRKVYDDFEFRIDTTDLSPERVVDCIVGFLNSKV